MVKCWSTCHSHPLRTFALFVLPEPRDQKSRETCAALVRETLRLCDTLRQVELQWRRWSVEDGTSGETEGHAIFVARGTDHYNVRSNKSVLRPAKHDVFAGKVRTWNILSAFRHTGATRKVCSPRFVAILRRVLRYC